MAQLNPQIDAELSDTLEEVAAEIKLLHPESTVILFGSYARGDAHKDSDLDICILVPKLTTRRLYMIADISCLIRSALRKNRFPLDTLVYTYDEFNAHAKFKSTLQHTIKSEGVTIGGD